MKEKLKEIEERFETAVSFKNTEARFVKTSNPRFKYFEGQISPYFKLENLVAFFGTFHSSYTVQVYLDGNMMTITTRNSTYVFEILEVELLEWFEDGVLFEMSDKEIEIMEEWLRGDGL